MRLVLNPGALTCAVVQELVQVESLAQMGVQLLLFALGLEFSLNKLRAVRSVALLGELSQALCCGPIALNPLAACLH